jgi:hypothetical protein
MTILFQQDLANIEAGLYPLPADHDGSLLTLLYRSRRFFEDLPEIHRRRVALAAKGNGPAQRAVIEAVQAIEQEIEAQAVARQRDQAKDPALSDLEFARRIAFVLAKGRRTTERSGR